ncbi:FecCD family ABC transporter permease [Pelagibacterium luteolum]|uniref:Iron complex transport system permease protein n=1 Tax=Pelagibacterium luteolum TaxID=440168 RepID=A0A1G7YJI8_9HYPH|nr:iron ABC transporter permease [Pelagibacterium luteolum]SDG96712.1 iron complex transport system permease protein [Pelagibacterium luteolum]
MPSTDQVGAGPVTDRPVPNPYTREASRRWLILLLLSALLVGLATLSLTQGAFDISVEAIIGILADRLGLDATFAFTSREASVLLTIRLPRLLLAAAVGASLGACGGITQAVFRNPLASPSVIGISGGAAVGAASSLVLGFAAMSRLGMPLSAFVGALAATTVVYGFARRRGRTEVTTLLLAGIAINAIAGALLNLLQALSNEAQLQSIVFWLMGSVSGATWGTLTFAVPLMAVSMIPLMINVRSLNLMILGEAEARNLGVETECVRIVCIFGVALATGASVAAAGVVPFVGLVVPHIMRAIIGPDNRTLIPGSMIGGAILVTVADLLGRTIVAPTQLPLGFVTALIGGPFFLYLVWRMQRQQGSLP